jgi:hypothetical protein
MFLCRTERNPEKFGHLAICPAESFDQHDRSALVLGQAVQGIREGRLDPWHLGVLWSWEGARPSEEAAPFRVTDPVKVSNRILHFGNAIPVFPCPGECLCRRLASPITAPRSHEGVTQAGFGFPDELGERVRCRLHLSH